MYKFFKLCPSSNSNPTIQATIVVSFALLLISTVPLLNFQGTLAQTTDSTNETESTFAVPSSDNTFDTNQALLSSSDLVDFVSNEYQIRGHLNASIINKDLGNASVAMAHAAHPVAEVYPLIALPLANANSTLNQTLYSSLLELPELVRNTSTADYKEEVMSVVNIVEQASKAVISEGNKNNVTFNLMVIADLLDIGGHEYEEAITNGSITALVEYQDSQAFIQQAESLLQTINSIDQDTAAQTQALNPLFENVNQRISDIASPLDVNQAIDETIQQIASIAGVPETSITGDLES